MMNQTEGARIIDNNTAVVTDLILAAERAYRRGIQTGSGGNLSARIPGADLMLVKGSGVSFIDCRPDNLIVTDFNGDRVEGNGKPTREALLHGAIYRHCPQINGIVHCHSPWSIVWAQTKQDLPLLTYHARLKLKACIPTVDIKAGVVPQSDMGKILGLFEAEPALPAFLLVAHGVVTMAEDVLNAEHVAELIEESAQIAVMDALARKLSVI